MKDKKHIKTFEQHQENLNISDVMNSSFSCDIYITNAGLRYQEYANLIRLDETENGYNYLVIDSYEKNGDNYKVGTIVKDLENLYVERDDKYDLKNSKLWGDFLFHFFLKNYCS
jgi:hypothetical protein